MREDMAKVIVERPRHGRGHATLAKRALRRALNDDVGDDAVKQAPMRGRYTNRKSFDDHLGPLWRFLSSRVGKPWNKVHSEICEHLRPISTMHRHILQHLWQMVQIDNLRVDEHGDPWTCWRWAPQRWHRLTGAHNFWVHPKTGILRRAPVLPRPRPQVGREDVRIAGSHVYAREGGIWYEMEMAPVPAAAMPWGGAYHARDSGPYDVILGGYVDQTRYGNAWRLYGSAERYAKKKARQLSTHDLRRLGLSNEAPRR